MSKKWHKFGSIIVLNDVSFSYAGLCVMRTYNAHQYNYSPKCVAHISIQCIPTHIQVAFIFLCISQSFLVSFWIQNRVHSLLWFQTFCIVTSSGIQLHIWKCSFYLLIQSHIIWTFNILLKSEEWFSLYKMRFIHFKIDYISVFCASVDNRMKMKVYRRKFKLKELSVRLNRCDPVQGSDIWINIYLWIFITMHCLNFF